MKNIFILFALFVGTFTSNAQSISYYAFTTILPSLESEDWETAYKESTQLLKNAPDETSEFIPIVRYINILSAAGMVTEGKMTYETLKKNIMKYQGQKIMMPAHPLATKDGILNQIKIEKKGNQYEGFTTATNKKGINILCFEKFYFKDSINLDTFSENTLIRCHGILDKIETNPNESSLWILRLTIKDAIAVITN